MQLQDLIKAIKEDSLTKEQVEAYFDQMTELFAEMMIEMAELEKAEAIFMNQGDESVAGKQVKWKATKEGQRLIVLKRYTTATSKLISSLKSRIFRLVY